MSETQDISETETRNMPAIGSGNADIPIDFGPLLGDDTDEYAFNEVPPHLRPRRGRKRWIFWASLIILLILIGGGILTYLNLSKPPAVVYNQSTAMIGNLTVSVSATGSVAAGAVYDLNFSASAPVKTINVTVGQKVNAGDVLATLDPTTLQDAVTTAQSNVTSAQTSVNAAQTSLNNTENQQSTSINIAFITEQDALKACVTNNGSSGGNGNGSGSGAAAAATPTPDQAAISRCEALARDQYAQSINQANSSITSARNQVTSAQQSLATARTNLQTAQDNLSEATMKAPHAGTVEVINGQVGSNPGSGGSSSGSSGSSAFIEMIDTSSLNISASVSEANIASVAVDQPATFTVAAYPSATFRASVSSIETEGTTTSSVVNFPMNLAVDMASVGTDKLYPGMTATVGITTAERISTLLIPSSALTFYATALSSGELNRNSISALGQGAARSGATGSSGIVIELKNGKLVPVPVTIGLTNGTQTEILSGLKENDQIVISQTGGATAATSTGTGTGTGTGRGGAGGFGGGGFGGGGGGGGR